MMPVSQPSTAQQHLFRRRMCPNSFASRARECAFPQHHSTSLRMVQQPATSQPARKPQPTGCTVALAAPERTMADMTGWLLNTSGKARGTIIHCQHLHSSRRHLQAARPTLRLADERTRVQCCPATATSLLGCLTAAHTFASTLLPQQPHGC